jgi:hypothetical protein
MCCVSDRIDHHSESQGFSVVFNIKSAPLLRFLASAALFVGLGMAVLSGRLFLDGKRHYENAKQAQADGESWRMIVQTYENAAKTYFPGNPYPQRALRELSILARSAEMRGDTRQAVYVWEVIRRSAVSQRHVSQPFKSYLAEAHARLDHLRTTKNEGSIEKDGLEDPSTAGVILLWFGLLIWISGALLAIWSQGKRARLVFVVSSMAGAIVWILSALSV